jgi:hypothetical protein
MILLPALLLTGCALFAEEEGPPVEVTAAQEAGGIRVHFFLREGDVSAKKVMVTADAGIISDYVQSSDFRHVTVLWADRDRTLRAEFPYGEVGEFTADSEVLDDRFAYVFHQGRYASVTSNLARGAPMLPRLLLTVEVDQKALPAEMQWESRAVRKLTKKRSYIIMEFPADKEGVLEAGDWTVTLTTKFGKETFRIGLDTDGVPTATSGHVRRSQ